MKKWKILETKTLFKNQWFDVKEDKVQLNEELALDGVLVLSFTDWVNVVPLTPGGQLLVEKQYRHGISDFCIETPSGSMEVDDPNPEFAAQRELREETGYTSQEWILIGVSRPNPQLMNNRMHHFLALNCTPTHTPEQGWDEAIEFWPMDWIDVLEGVRNGTIHNSLTVEGLLRADDWLRLNPRT